MGRSQGSSKPGSGRWPDGLSIMELADVRTDVGQTTFLCPLAFTGKKIIKASVQLGLVVTIPGALCAPGRSTAAIPGGRRPFHVNHRPQPELGIEHLQTGLLFGLLAALKALKPALKFFFFSFHFKGVDQPACQGNGDCPVA